MSILDRKLIHTRKLFATENVSKEFGERLLRKLKESGAVSPEVIPSGRVFVSPNEAEAFHRELRSA